MMYHLNRILIIQGIYILVALVCFVWSQIQYPSLKSLKPGQEVKSNGVYIIRGNAERSLGLTIQDMEDLIYGVEEIPSFAPVPNPYNGNHTNIFIDGEGIVILNPIEYSLTEKYIPIKEKYFGSYIERIWYNIDAVEEYYLGLIKWSDLCKRDYIHIKVNILDRRIEYQIPEGWPKKPKAEVPVGEEAYWITHITLMFRLKSVYVIIESRDKGLTEALAFGIEYRIQQHPKRLGMAQRPITLLVANKPFGQGKVISLAGVTVAPLSTLEPAQVVLETKRTKTEWMVTARRNGQWVKVKAFSWEMETDKGKVKLERPVFPYKGELVVPLRQVAEALGISVQQKGQTIALLPK